MLIWDLDPFKSKRRECYTPCFAFLGHSMRCDGFQLLQFYLIVWSKGTDTETMNLTKAF